MAGEKKSTKKPTEKPKKTEAPKSEKAEAKKPAVAKAEKPKAEKTEKKKSKKGLLWGVVAGVVAVAAGVCAWLFLKPKAADDPTASPSYS